MLCICVCVCVRVCVFVFSLSVRSNSFAAPWTIAHQVPLSVGFFRQEYWSGLPFPLPGNLPDPGIEPMYPVFPALAGGFSTTKSPGNPQPWCSIYQYFIPLYGWIMFQLFFNPFTRWLYCFYFLPLMNNTIMNIVYKYLCGHRLPTFLGIYLGMDFWITTNP